MILTSYDYSNLTINYVSAPCASGKTHSAVRFIQFNYKHSLFVVTVPTLKLAGQYLNEFKDLNIPVKYVASNSPDDETKEKSKSVKERIIKTVKKMNKFHEQSGVLLITQAAFDNLPPNVFNKSWNLIVDEIPQCDKNYSMTIPYNHYLLTDMITVDTKINLSQYQLKLSNVKQAKEFLKRKVDDIDALFKPVIQDLMDGYQVVVDIDGWDHVVDNYYKDNLENPDGNHTFHFVSFKTPINYTQFGNAVIMGANFERGMLYTIWKDYFEVKFKIHKTITSGLRYITHPNASLLTVIYLQEDNYSRFQARCIEEDGELNISKAIAKARSILGDEGVLCILNKADEHLRPAGWTGMSMISHGLNSYTKFNKIFFGAALNRKPKHASMIGDYGVSSQVIESRHNEAAYQAISRTNIRDLTSTTPTIVVVQDKRAAEYIASCFVGCNIQPADGVKKKVIKLSRQEKIYKNKIEILLENRLLTQSLEDEDNCPKGHHNLTCHMYSPKKHDTSNYLLNLNWYLNVASRKSGENKQITITEFVDEMEQWAHNNRINHKEDNVLFNEGSFEDNGRKKDDLESTKTVVLDIDGGDLDPDEFFDIFSIREKLSFFMTNSASNGIDGISRYRAVFFTDILMTPIVHNMIFDYIIATLETYHYYTPKNNDPNFLEECKKRDPLAKLSGIDWSKRNGASIFYAPCTVNGREEHAFFRRSYTSEYALKSHSIKVEQVIKHSKYNEPPVQIVVEGEELKKEASIKQAKEAKAIESIEKILSEMTPNHRSYPASQIAGHLKSVKTASIRAKIEQEVRSKGCDKAAMKSFEVYLKQRN